MIGTKLGHHEILERIGAGGMGVVYLASDATSRYHYETLGTTLAPEVPRK